MDHVHAVILAGGGGTRLWPLSRRARPKQLLRLAGSETLLGACATRMGPLCPPERTWVVTTRQLAPQIQEALPQLPAGNIVIEPAPRNTAPAIALAAKHLLSRDRSAVMAVLPSDHHIADEDGFRETVAHALRAAADDRIVTCAIRPTHPETGFGYVEVGSPVDGVLHRGVCFREKPDLATAEKLVREGRSGWNSGMFFLRADRMISEVQTHLPALASALDQVGTPSFEAAWNRAPAISIDYGIMEKVERFFCVWGAFGWNDIGSFASLPRNYGEVLEVDATANLVHAEGKTVALLGVQDLCVIVTNDAVLVCPKARAQEVRSVVQQLERDEKTRLL